METIECKFYVLCLAQLNYYSVRGREIGRSFLPKVKQKVQTQSENERKYGHAEQNLDVKRMEQVWAVSRSPARGQRRCVVSLLS